MSNKNSLPKSSSISHSVIADSLPGEEAERGIRCETPSMSPSPLRPVEREISAPKYDVNHPLIEGPESGPVCI